MSVPDVDLIEGLPPAVALQQQRGSPTARSSVGSVTTISNLLRMLYSRAGAYPPGQPHLDAESFSANTPEGACPQCHGLGRVHEVTEASMVPDLSLTIRERAVAAWPLAWGGQNLRDILITLGIDVDRPWRELPENTRQWILFVVEHELDVVRHADWIVDVGPAAGELGGEVLYSGPPEGLRQVERSKTARHLFAEAGKSSRTRREPDGWLRLSGLTRNNLRDVDCAFPLGVMTTVTGISGSGKSSLVSQALVELVGEALGAPVRAENHAEDDAGLEVEPGSPTQGMIEGGFDKVRRLIEVDQKPIGRTPRSNLATYTGLFDHVRSLFAATPEAKKRRYDAGRFSFNVAKGRCPRCEGEGFVMVELLFLPSVYAPCPTCHGTRYNPQAVAALHRSSLESNDVCSHRGSPTENPSSSAQCSFR